MTPIPDDSYDDDAYDDSHDDFYGDSCGSLGRCVCQFL